jgi:glycosyltransferase involved in cell wall biosynthesis
MRSLSAQGATVYALAADYDDHWRAQVAALGAQPMDISLDRAGVRPVRDFLDLLKLRGTLRELRPDVQIGYFIKPVIYGSIAGMLARVPRRYAVIAGLGYVFTAGAKEHGWKRKLLRLLVTSLYRLGLAACHRVFFLNPDDRQQFIQMRLVPEEKTVLLQGEGVPLEHFRPAPPVLRPLRFLLIARLLREKGVAEFAEAARIVRARYPDAEFHLVGSWDANPGSLPLHQVEAWVQEGVIQWHGYAPDVRPWIERCSVYVLPSYREGKPRSTQEAMSMARPIVTTDVPGCRDTVDEGVNGFKVPVRDVQALADALLRFIENPHLIARMGAESRRIAEERFDVHQINAVVMDVIGLSGGIGRNAAGAPRSG